MNLLSLERRRLRGDLIEAYKCITGIDQSTSLLFSLNENSTLRGHTIKLVNPRCDTTVRANSFNKRVINHYNKLPSEVVTSSRTNASIYAYDVRWNSVFLEMA